MIILEIQATLGFHYILTIQYLSRLPATKFQPQSYKAPIWVTLLNLIISYCYKGSYIIVLTSTLLLVILPLLHLLLPD